MTGQSPQHRYQARWLVAIVCLPLILSDCATTPNIVVVDQNTIKAYPITANGNVAPSFTIMGSNTGIDIPEGIVSDRVGSLTVANSDGITTYLNVAHGNVRPIAWIAGSNTVLAGAGLPNGLGGVAGLTLDPGGNINAIGVWLSEVAIYARGSTGNVAPIATIAGSNTGLSQPIGIGVDSSGKIYVANFSSNNAQGQGQGDGNITIYAPGSNGNVAPIETIITASPRPVAMAVDDAGTIYVVAEYMLGSSISVYPPGATSTTPPQRVIEGNRTGLVNTMGIAVDNGGNIYVTNATVPAGVSSIFVFGPTANGNVPPKAIITGDKTGLVYPEALTIQPFLP